MRYFSLWFEFIKNNFKRQIIFKTNFWLQILGHFIWFFLSLLFFRLIYFYTPHIGGWKMWHAFSLLSINQIVILLSDAFFGINLQWVPELVESGLLDKILTLPCDAQFFLSTRLFNFRALFSLPVPVGVLIFSLWKTDFSYKIHYFILFLVFLGVAVLIRYFMGVLIMLLSFKFVRIQALYALYQELLSYAGYPESIFSGGMKIFFTFVVPILLLANFPFRVLQGYFNFPLLMGVLEVLLCLGVFARFLFIKALKAYTSAGG